MLFRKRKNDVINFNDEAITGSGKIANMQISLQRSISNVTIMRRL